MGILVLACYEPKTGRESDLDTLLKGHVNRLKEWGLATDRKPILMKSEQGIRLEIFEWKSKEAIEKAHEHEKVLEMWQEFEEVCHYIAPGSMQELSELFPEFKPL